MSEKPLNVVKVHQISPFRYPGGKTWLVPLAREWLQAAERPKVLLEPFAGGAAIGLTAAAEGLVDHVTLVELDNDVSAVWEVLINGSDRSATMLGNKILRFNVTLENVRSVLDMSPKTVIERAFRTIVKNRCQYGGIMTPYAGLIKTGDKGKGLSSRWYPETIVKRFGVIRRFCDRITFQQGEALDAIKSNSGAMMFIDPPYTFAGKRAGLKLYNHTNLDHEKLFEHIAEHADRALLTYDDTFEVRQLAERHHFDIESVKMRSAHHAVMRELTIFKR